MADLVGKVLVSRYRVDAFIGKGGMAEVYKVWDRERAVFLALKVLYSDLAEDKIFLRRFEREAETLSSLQHPYIVRFYGLEQDNGLSFMLMDYVEGTTLRKLIFDARKPFSPQHILQIMRPVCSALHYAHEMGRVHCDIKPANIMVKSNGDVLVADFGIARMMESGTTMTMAGAGTPAYMAPEQVLGRKPSPQTDIYSLGIVLYEMLTGGERPFTGEQAKIEGTTSEKVRWEQTKLPPPSPRENNPAISRELEKVVLSCLKKDPAQRYATTLELLRALEITLDTEKITQDFTEATQIKPPVDEVIAPQQKEIPRKPSSKARMRGIGTVVGLSVFIGIVLMAILRPEFLNDLINASPTVIASVDSSTTINLPAATEISTESPPTPTEPAIPTPEPTEPATMTASAPATEITDDFGAQMVLVSEGEFQMGSNDPQAEPDEQPVHPIHLDAYYIDKFEVTNALYAACVNAGVCKPPIQTDSFTRSSYYDNSEYNEYPVVYVNWNMARAYCEWRGTRLPSEAEWEKAARGTDERIYPWGEGHDCQKVNYRSCANGTSKVGSYERGKSPYGAYDMAGNVWEWVADWYANTYYETSLPANPPGPDSGQSRVYRGGSWNSNEYDIRASNRLRQSPGYYNFDIGFRCAQDASP